MAPVVLPDDNIIQNGYPHDVSGSELEDNDKTGQKPGFRRDSDGSTGYSTCSSNLSSVSQLHEDRSPRSPDSDKDEERKELKGKALKNKTSQAEEEENDGDVETNNDDDENGNELEISKKSDKHMKLSPVDFVNQICANQRCLSAGYKGKKKEKGLENIRRGSNGYNTATEVKNKQVTPESLGEAITTVINKLEDNIKDLKYTQDETIKHLKDEQESKFLQFTFEQEQTLRKINQNIVQAEEETLRIKREHDVALEVLKENILNVSNGSTELMNEKENIFNEKQEEIQNITQQHETFIKDLTENLDKISNENKESVSMLLANLDKAKKENELVLDNHNKSLNELKEFQERSIIDLKNDLEAAKQMSEHFKTQTEEKNQNFEEENLELKSKLAYHDTAIKALENTLQVVTEKNNEMHESITETHKKSLGELRQEVFSQVMVVKEISRSVQEEFNDKLENVSKILDDEKISNKEKIEEVREALDGIDIDIKNKMKETTDNLLEKIHEEVKNSGEGKYGLDLEISVVKDMLDSLSSKVSQMNEKMYDFEQNKRNNLIFYGMNQDAGETPESLAITIQKLIKEKMLLRREMNITQAARDDHGPAVSGRRPVIVTFENFKDREAVLRRAEYLKKCNMQVTEDFSKSVREQRAHLARFMKNWKRQSPKSYAFLRYDKLYIDNRLFVYDKEKQEVVEQDGHESRGEKSSASRPGSSASRVWSRPSSSLSRQLSRSNSRPSSSAMSRSISNVSLNRPKSFTRLPRTMSAEVVSNDDFMTSQESITLLPGVANLPMSPKKTKQSWQHILNTPLKLN